MLVRHFWANTNQDDQIYKEMAAFKLRIYLSDLENDLLNTAGCDQDE